MSLIIDTLHVAQSLTFVLGGFFIPVDHVPAFLVGVIYMLSRYHDYCVLSELSRVIREYYRECRDEESLQDFSSFWRDWVWGPIGLDINQEFQQNLNTAKIAISGFVALYRFCKRHGATLFRPLKIVLFCIAVIAIGEASIQIWFMKDPPTCTYSPAEFFFS